MNLQELLYRTVRTRWAGTKAEGEATRNALKCVQTLGPTTPAKDITARMINDMRSRWKSEGAAPATINRRLSALSAMLSLAEEDGVIKARPTIRREKEPEGRTRVITDAEASAIQAQLTKEYRALCVVLADTAIRVGEALGLQWEDVAADHITLRNTKGGRPRAVPLTPRASEALESRREARGGPFTGITASKWNKAWNRAKAAAGLGGDPEVVPHSLRHTCASKLVRRGVHLTTVKEWLGHASIQTTMRYAHFDTSALREACTKLTA